MANINENEALIQKVILEPLKFKISTSYGSYMAENIKVYEDRHSSAMLNQIMYHMQFKIMGQKNVQEYSVIYEIPLNWWEHFKQDVLPKWVLSRFPVTLKKIKRTISFDHLTLMPDLNLPSDEHRIVMHTPKPIDDGVYFNYWEN